LQNKASQSKQETRSVIGTKSIVLKVFEMIMLFMFHVYKFALILYRFYVIFLYFIYTSLFLFFYLI